MSILRHLLFLTGAAALLLYIANPGAGVLELIPDALPIIGNLDEAAATGLLIALVKRWRNPGGEPSKPSPRDATSPDRLPPGERPEAESLPPPEIVDRPADD